MTRRGGAVDRERIRVMGTQWQRDERVEGGRSLWTFTGGARVLARGVFVWLHECWMLSGREERAGAGQRWQAASGLVYSGQRYKSEDSKNGLLQREGVQSSSR